MVSEKEQLMMLVLLLVQLMDVDLEILTEFHSLLGC